MKQSFGNTDTPISGVTAPVITLPVINFNSDYRIRKSADSETIVTNVTTPFDQPESVRYSIQDVKDIYKNAGLNSDQITGSKEGVSLVAQLNTTLKVTDDTATTAIGYFPITAHLVIKCPKSGYITESVLTQVIARLNGTLYAETGKTNIVALLKGALNPKGL